jgi:nitroreductase
VEFRDVVRRRRMVRNYTDDPVDRETIDRIVTSALKAPSAGFSQGQSLIIVTDAGARREIARLAGEDHYVAQGFDPWISSAPVHIVICTSEQVYRDRYAEPDKLGPDGDQIEWPVPYWWVDAGASLMLLLLAAVDEGLAAGFLGVHAIPDLKRLLGIPDDVEPIGVVTIGHPAPDRKSGSLKRGRRSGTVHWERWRKPL